MFTFIVSLIIFVAILLVLVILAQNSKGGGLSSQFGGSGASNMIGIKKTSDLLEKITWGLAIVMLVLTLASNVQFSRPSVEDEFSDRVEEQGPALDFSDQIPPMPEGGAANPAVEDALLDLQDTTN